MKLLFQQFLPTTLISSILATPAPTLRDTRRTAPVQSPSDCTYVASQNNANAACWDLLDLTKYLTGWTKTTPICPSDNSSLNSGDADCCHGDEVWASCFLRLATGTSDPCIMGPLTETADCYNRPLDLRSSLDPKIVDQVGYVLTTIKNINGFIAVYSSTLSHSAADLTGHLTLNSDLLPKIDPSGRTTLGFAEIVDALDLGLPFLNSPSILPPPSLTNQTLLASSALSTGLTSSPAAAAAFFILSTASHRTLPAKFLSQDPFQYSSNRLVSLRDLLMADLPTFTSFATKGSFSSTNFSLALGDSEPHLNLALSTHIVSELLGQNDWFGVPLRIATHADFASSCGEAAARTIYDTNTYVCQNVSGEATFWSPITRRIYALRYQGAKNNQKLAPMDMLTTVYNSTVVDMPTLFDGAYNCTAEGKAGGAVVNTNVGAGGDGNGPGTLDMSCLSRLPIYLQCKDACPMSVRVDGKCPFGLTGKGC